MLWASVRRSSFQLDSGLVESHTFTYKCPILGCGCCYDRFTSFERHLTHVHGASGIGDFDSEEYIDKERVRVGRREDLFRAYKRKAERGKESGKRPRLRVKTIVSSNENDEDY